MITSYVDTPTFGGLKDEILLGMLAAYEIDKIIDAKSAMCSTSRPEEQKLGPQFSRCQLPLKSKNLSFFSYSRTHLDSQSSNKLHRALLIIQGQGYESTLPACSLAFYCASFQGRDVIMNQRQCTCTIITREPYMI